MSSWACDKCGKTVVGKRSEHCPGCHETFTTTVAGDYHRRDFRCHDPATLRREDGNPRLERDAHGRWRLWLTPNQRNAQRRFIERRSGKRDQALEAEV